MFISGNSFSDNILIEDIIDDFFVFLVAGMETTAITMSCLMWLLLKHPEISKKVVAEVKPCRNPSLSYDILPGLGFNSLPFYDKFAPLSP
jgi:cytochrome P450